MGSAKVIQRLKYIERGVDFVRQESKQEIEYMVKQKNQDLQDQIEDIKAVRLRGTNKENFSVGRIKI